MRIKDPENTGLFKCKHHNPIKHCRLLELDPLEQVSVEKKCKLCEFGYFLTDSGAKCEKLTTKCLSTEGGKCTLCYPGYVPSTKAADVTQLKCKKVGTVIDECRFYLRDGACKICKQGYYLDSMGRKCLSDKKGDKVKCLNP
jgi:hypothetical protein